ncbi:site-specific integrase [Salmonella enterica]|jgi:integrase|nr:site-specific integrase [Salmonella enterica]HCD3001656.1 site-specific integrase [Klebsiella pneumoniae]EFO8095161.1 site-specific integrase [Salmonella enterica]HCD3612719.1 site-specific integrase [Klebsiella pneumoniae]HCD5965796.1 site-specific integrase [Klebsiella pneumoniae]
MEKTATKSNSKRNISKLNENFRESILDYAISHNLKCAPGLIALYATGCRPDELKTGIKVNFNIKTNELEFRVLGSKLNRAQRRGIAIRKIKVKVTDKNIQYYKPIVDIFEKNPGAYDFKIQVESSKAFSGYITKISKKIWPRKKYHASAYSFRHAKATELKNSNFDTETIAQVMGHASVRSQLSYGRKNRRSNVGGFDDITEVETSSKPRGGDRLLRFKIANKNEASKKLSEGISASQPATTAPVRKLKR